MKTQFGILFFLWIILTSSIQAQTISADKLNNRNFKKISVECTPWSMNLIKTGFRITGMSIILPAGSSFYGCYIVTGTKDTLAVFQEEDDLINPQAGDKLISNLIFFENPVTGFYFYNNTSHKIVIFDTYYSGEERPDNKPGNHKRADIDCSKPQMVDQSEWRSGLTPPAHGPEYTKPEHIIIHHSVTPNYANKLQVVRNIYIKHTETNGWNDIAYNYLVARDGTIYKGRDGQGVYDGDFVKGAHFCKKNSNTLGVCLIGTYNKESPTPEAWQALKKLMAWKLYKDNMNPLDSFIHPENTGSKYLGVIAGHRDGCTTDCPGDSVYPRLPNLRIDMKTLVDNCDKTNSIFTSASNKFNVYPSPAFDYIVITSKKGLKIKGISVLSLDGKVMLSNKYPGRKEERLPIRQLPEGIYFLKILSGRSVENIQFIKTGL